MSTRWPGLEVVCTEGPGHATTVGRGALESGAKLVVAVGGDGTANEVLCAFMDDGGVNRFPGAELGLLGGGTGGDFLRQLGSPSWPEMIDALEQPGRTVDYGAMRFVDHDGQSCVRPFLNAASAGVTGHIVARVLQAGGLSRKLLGAKGIYLWHSIAGILGYRNPTVELQVDETEPRRLDLALATATNGQYFGGGMWIAPNARLDDGRLEMIYTGDISKGKLLGLLAKVFGGKHLDHPAVEAGQGQRLHMRSVGDDPVLVEIDGEQPGVLPAEFWVVPDGIRVRVAGLPAAAQA